MIRRMKLNCDKKTIVSNFLNFNKLNVQIVLFLLISLKFITCNITTTMPTIMPGDNGTGGTTNGDNSNDFEALKANFSFDYAAEPYKIRINANFNEQQMGHLKLRKLSDPKSTTRSINENNLSNLRPCTKYNITAEIKNPDNVTQKFMHSEIISTSYATPRTTWIQEHTFSNRIYLKWSTDNRECVKASEIQVRRVMRHETKKIDITKTHELTITDLKPCTKYHINLVTLDANNTVVQNISKVEETLYVNPGQVDHINYVKHKNSVTLHWQPPTFGRNCLKNYTIRYAKKVGHMPGNWIEHTIPADDFNRLELDGLSSCARYVFTISSNSVQASAATTEEFETDFDTPGQVTNVRIEHISPVNVTVRWDPPDKNPGCVAAYCARIPEDSLQWACTQELHMTLENLQPCNNYTVLIVVRDTGNRLGESTEKSFRTLEDNPSMVQNIVSSATESYLRVDWHPPKYGAFCVKHYRYAVWYTEHTTHNAYDNETDDKFVIFNDLIACTGYTIQIIPVGYNETIEGQPNMHAFVSQPRVAKQPTRPDIEAISKSSVTLASNYTDATNRCRVRFVKFTCKPDPTLHPNAVEAVSQVEIKNNQHNYHTVVENLVPYTNYKCSASINNVQGWSDDSETMAVLTDEDFPGPPQNIVAYAMDNATIRVQWSQPSSPNGKITMYRLMILLVGPYHPLPAGCERPPAFNDTVLTDEKSLEYIFRNGLPHFEYQFQVSAANGAGIGRYTQPASAVTLSSTPERISKVSHGRIVGPFVNASYSASVLIEWVTPCHLNGNLVQFVIDIVGRRPGVAEPDIFSEIVSVHAVGTVRDKYEYNETRLKPEFTYQVVVHSVVRDGGKSVESEEITFQAPAGIPVIESDKEWGSVGIVETPDPKINALITFAEFIFDSRMGEIRYIALLVAERGCQDDPEPTSGLFNTSIAWPNIRSWQEATKSGCIDQYQTTPAHWSPLVAGRSAYTGGLQYVIGNESCVPDQKYCNGPLKAGTEYTIIVRLFTGTGYSDSMQMFFRTDEMILIETIIISVTGCLVLSFILGLLIFMRKNMKNKMRHSQPEDTENMTDIPVPKFADHYFQMSALDGALISNEYKVINAIDGEALGYTTLAAKQNEVKNRYTNIHPYDHNRVLLTGTNDYVNASYVDGYKYPKEYIATQGPKYESTADFWRMLLQCHVEIVVMLTQLVENDREKCYQYYPKFNEEAIYNDIHVKCTQEINLHVYVRRLFEISRNHEQWCCTHYCFQKWPDHGVCPPGDLIKFTKVVRNERKIPTSPVIVHCSAGVGRTGTFIALDIIIQRMQKEKKINIFSTVRELRRQRVKMVQTCDQYKLLYQCALELAGKNSKKDKLYQKNIREDYNFDGIGLNHTAMSANKAKLKTDNNNGTSFVPNDVFESGI